MSRVDACRVDGFRIEARGVASIEDDVTLKWDEKSYLTDDVTLKWNLASYLIDDVTLKWNTLIAVQDDITLKWHCTIGVIDDVTLKWNQKNNVIDDIILKWNDAFVTSDIIIKWSDGWLADDVTLKWNNLHFIQDDITLKWNLISYLTDDLTLKWNLASYLIDDVTLKWNNLHFVQDDITIKWHEGPPLPGLVDYLEVITAQGDVIYPDMITVRAELKPFGTLDSYILHLKEPIPEDSKCRLYLKGSVIYLEGLSRSCIRKYDFDSGLCYEVEVREYAEILKPIEPKGGLYLVKESWENVTVSQLLASAEPPDNSDIIGLIYMAASAIDFEFWAVHDAENGIYKFDYEGAAFSISTVYQDATALTERVSAAALESASGWYHDSANKILYVRLTDDTSPYYHVVSVPYIWDGIMPVRLGVVSSGGSTNIAYWETANGDIPLETINTLLLAVGLEAEASVRNGICYIDVTDRAGAGTVGTPAQFYHATENIKDITEIILNDARYTVAGVILSGYGSGAGAVHAGAYRNMGRGGRKVRLDDASMHSTTQAQDYVTNYLNDAYLPAHGVTFDVPLVVGPSIDKRRVGDTIKVEIPKAFFNQVLRIQELKPEIAKNNLTITAGDAVYSLESQLQALKSANEKYRRHLEDTMEPYNFAWDDINIDHVTALSETFDIDSDVLDFQKLEVSVSVQNYRTDMKQVTQPGLSHAHGGQAGPGGTSHGGHDVSEDEESDSSADTPTSVATDLHTHDFETGAPDETTSVPTSGHIHDNGTLATSASSAGTTNAVTSLGVASCTATNCTKSFYSCITGTVAVISSTHTHPISGWTGGPNNTVNVASSLHQHTGTTAAPNAGAGMLISLDALGHTHPIAGKKTDTIPDSFTPAIDVMLAESILNDVGIEKSEPGSTPEMYLAVEIDGTPITGSPFIIGEAGAYTYNEDDEIWELSDDVGPVSIVDAITTTGTHSVSLSLSNKTSPGSACKVMASVRINGRFYVSIIST
ncbi:MAG: hypothetical protein WC455_21140 [Dehalococcoidia bacterium]|jgi:hypothetical protein